MAVMVDLFCPECDHREVDVMVDTKKQMPECEKCKTEMKRIVGCTHFELKYNSRTDSTDWHGNSSRYWNDIKEKGGDEPSNPRQQKWW